VHISCACKTFRSHPRAQAVQETRSSERQVVPKFVIRASNFGDRQSLINLIFVQFTSIF